MSRGIVVLAQNSKTENYVDQAVVLAQSVMLTNPDIPVSVITDDGVDKQDQGYFDQIIPIPWGDLADGKYWKVENRWKVFHASPYKETIVLDTDILFLENIEHWWNFFKNYDLYFPTTVKTYRNEIVSSDYYRKTFTSNDLPNVYTGMYYFKRCEFTHNFFAYLEIVMRDWEKFYDVFLKENKPEHISVDVCAAIVCKLMDYTPYVTNPATFTPTFTHMKSQVQHWRTPRNKWLDYVNPYLDNACSLKIGNHLQSGLFHYTEKDFLEITNAKEKYRSVLDV
jgi:hypothetical protein